MSTLVTSNISDGTTSVGTGYVVNGSAKAYGHFDMISTLTMLDSLNISSSTDNGAGDTNQNFTNAFSANTYAVAGSADPYGLSGNAACINSSIDRGNSTTLAKVLTRLGTTSVDMSSAHFTIHGDLA